MSLEVFGILFAGFLTLCIYSFLYKDNAFYRFAEYLFVGVSAGYTLARAFNDVFDKKIWGPMVDPAPGTSVEWTLLIPIILGIFLILKLVPQVSWLSRWALAFVVGGTIGLSMTSRFKSDVINQIKATISPFQAVELSSYELYGKMSSNFQALASKQGGNVEDEFLALNSFYTSYHHYLRVELKAAAGLDSNSADFPRTRLYSAIENEMEARKRQHSATAKLMAQMQRLSGHTPVLADQLRSDLQKIERETAQFVNDSADGLSEKEIVDEMFGLESRYKSKLKDLSTFEKLQASLKDSVESLRIKLADQGALSPRAPDGSQNLRAWVESEKSNWSFYQEILGTLKSLSSNCSAIAGLFPDGSELSTTKLESFKAIGGLHTAIGYRIKTTGTLLEADLNTAYPLDWKGLLYGFIIAVMVLAILIYFFFSTEHTGVVGVSATLGIYFLMICFGSSFGFTIMARISLLIGRISFLIGDFWNTLTALFGGG